MLASSFFDKKNSHFWLLSRIILCGELFFKVFKTIVYKIYYIVIITFMDKWWFPSYDDFYLTTIGISVTIFTNICLDECFCIRMWEMFFSIRVHLVCDVVFDSFVDFLFHDFCEIYKMCLILDVVEHGRYRYEINTTSL